ncbi:MAG TPA: ATP-binding protein [Xanthobacteraceae bacterium]|nr:ATP-binding protein [Xanthobacteraceae bacterium]
MHKLLARQLAKATTASGEIDIELLSQLVGSAYEQADRECRRTDRSIGLMVEELDAHLREREHVADLLRGQKMTLDATIASMADAVLVADQSGQIIVANPAAKALFGDHQEVGSEEWLRRNRRFLPDGVTPIRPHEAPMARAINGEAVDNQEIVLHRGGSDTTLNLIANGRPLRDPTGAPRGAVVVYRDITEAKETERLLRQSQKMDAIGQLTGGIAHDFNNILTVIIGMIEILAEEVADDPKIVSIAKTIAQAADRGAELTQHLLAFARKQPLRPREADVNALIIEATSLLRAALGEHIEIESLLDENALHALVDTSQLTTAILNLAVNARDAMPGGGRLTLETGNVHLDRNSAGTRDEIRSGRYVLIAVTDNGTGIPESIRDKVFEPFFTTKGIGRGTGLGLSMVYGFVKQSGGHIRIDSEEGRGTSIKIFLPLAPVQAESAATEAQLPGARGGRETILVVEDDALVRKYVTEQLESLGYRTLEAANGAEALAIVDSEIGFDLLFTDVIMPGSMNGRALAEQAVERRPTLKVLFTSGYTENAILSNGCLPSGVLLLPKPYRRSALAHMVRQALGSDQALNAA